MRKGAVTLRIMGLIVLTDVFESVAEVFFKKAVISTGMAGVSIGELARFAGSLLVQLPLWYGTFFYALNFVVWMAVLSKVELSVAFPAGSVTYVIVPLLSTLFLHEHVTALRWAGSLLIVAGICFVSRSAPELK